MQEIENPYQSPNDSSSRVRVTRFQKTSRFRFVYIVALIISFSFALTLVFTQRNELSFLTSLVFFGLTVAGPFMTLGQLIWGPGPLAVPIWCVAALVFSATTSYLIRPNNFTLVLSLIGALAWTMITPVIVVVLPELQIRI